MAGKRDQHAAPILEALARVERKGIAGFGGPGHDEGRGVDEEAAAVLGRQVFSADVLTPKGLDDRRQSAKVVQRADQLAAEAWHADVCRVSTGGSTQSLQTALLTVAAPGETVLIAQNAHRAAFAPSVFAGLDLRMISSRHDRERGLEFGPSAETVGRALDEAPHAKAVLVVSPTFFGTTSDIAALAAVCHARGTALIVDAAWGAAYPFSEALPRNPLDDGADLMILSVHKTMAALAQGSLILARGARIDRERLDLVHPLLQTTSPSVPILASLDATRRAHALEGETIWRRVAALAERAKAGLDAIDGVVVRGREILDGTAAYDLDRTKVVFDVRGIGCSGAEADEWLQAHRAVSVVLGDVRHCVAVFGVGKTEEDVDRLVDGVADLAAAVRAQPSAFRPMSEAAPGYGDLGFERIVAPRDAFYGATRHIPLAEAEGHIAAGFVGPVPPEIPRLMPGQRIGRTHVVFLQECLRTGGIVDGLGHEDGRPILRTARP